MCALRRNVGDYDFRVLYGFDSHESMELEENAAASYSLGGWAAALCHKDASCLSLQTARNELQIV